MSFRRSCASRNPAPSIPACCASSAVRRRHWIPAWTDIRLPEDRRDDVNPDAHDPSHRTHVMNKPPVLVSTTHSIEGRTIVDYKGLVGGDAILGANMFRDFFAGIRDL